MGFMSFKKRWSRNSLTQHDFCDITRLHSGVVLNTIHQIDQSQTYAAGVLAACQSVDGINVPGERCNSATAGFCARNEFLLHQNAMNEVMNIHFVTGCRM